MTAADFPSGCKCDSLKCDSHRLPLQPILLQFYLAGALALAAGLHVIAA